MTASERKPGVADGGPPDTDFLMWGELWNSLDPLMLLLVGGIVGYIFAISRDRPSAVRSRKIEAISKLHERVLEIERKELSDGRNMTLAIRVQGGTKKREGLLSDSEVDYLSMLEQWPQDLHEEEDRARLWIDRRTVRLVSTYFILMMHRKSWDQFGQGNLILITYQAHLARAGHRKLGFRRPRNQFSAAWPSTLGLRRTLEDDCVSCPQRG